jgi:hypothetical protein
LANACDLELHVTLALKAPRKSTTGTAFLESNLHHSPGNPGLVQIHPRPALRGAFAGSAKGARVQYAGQTDRFITRHVSMSVKQKVGSSDARRRNVYQKKRFPHALEKEALGQIESPVIVPKHTEKWPAHGFDCFKRCLVAKIPEMPDLIGPRQFLGDGGWKLPVSIGNYGNEHDEFSVYSLSV